MNRDFFEEENKKYRDGYINLINDVAELAHDAATKRKLPDSAINTAEAVAIGTMCTKITHNPYER